MWIKARRVLKTHRALPMETHRAWSVKFPTFGRQTGNLKMLKKHEF